MPVNPSSLDRVRRRSVGFLEREGDAWACFLVTYRDREGRWHGYFSFRPRDGEAAQDEIRTADIFLEGSEEEVDRKARELGRPLLNGLLSSAIHTTGRRDDDPPGLRQWFREMLSRNSQELSEASRPPAGAAPGVAGETARELAPETGRTPAQDPAQEPLEAAAAPNGSGLGRMRSLYESYRMDQVAHFICLLEPGDFRVAVDEILDGRAFEFGAKDRLQFAMIVVEHIEERLPLPPFEVWLEDYMAHEPAYQLYAHTLHREGRLP